VKKFLSKAQRAELLAELRLERYAKYSDRIKAILLLDDGECSLDIAKFLFLSEKTIRNYKKNYEEGGLEQLIMDDYNGKECSLTEVQIQDLVQHLSTTLYRTALEVKVYIWKTYKVDYSVGGLRHLLKRLGFVYKKPKAIPGKASREKQIAFIEILKKLKNSEDPLYFADGVHPQHNTFCEYGWILKGKDFELKTNTGRQRININGAINANDPKDVIIDETVSVNAQSTITLLKKIEAKNTEAKNIYVVVDNARYYNCSLVKEYLENSTIKLVFLPPYSPNLNLIERLWRVLNKHILYNQYYEKFSEFRKAVLGFFQNIKRYRQDIEKILAFNFHLVAA